MKTKKNIKIITDIAPEEEKLFRKQYLNLADLREEIDKEEDVKLDKRSKEYKTWKENINFLINLYNTRCGYKYYTPIK